MYPHAKFFNSSPHKYEVAYHMYLAIFCFFALCRRLYSLGTHADFGIQYIKRHISMQWRAFLGLEIFKGAIQIINNNYYY